MNNFEAKYLQIASTYLDEKLQVLKVETRDKKSSNKSFIFKSLLFWMKK